jgi:hypothetical protein
MVSSAWVNGEIPIAGFVFETLFWQIDDKL